MFGKPKYCRIHKKIRLQRIRRLKPGKLNGRGRKAWYCRICG